MTAHATAARLAEVLGCPKSTVLRRAQAEGWAYQEATGQGGARRLYMVEQLPAAVRAKLLWANRPAADAPPEARAAGQAGRAAGARLALRGALEARAADARRAAGLRQAAELPPGATARMDARLAVLRALQQFGAAHPGLPLAQTRILFAERYNAGELEVPAAVRAEVAATSAATLERWQREVRSGGIAALAGAYGNRAGSGTLDTQPELREFVQAMLVQRPHCRATRVMDGLLARFGARLDGLPSMRTLERWMAAWRHDNAEVLLALADPDKWKNRHMVAFGSASEHIERINQLWELDSTPADVMCTDGRHSIIGGIDVATRRAKLCVAPTSRATAVAALLRSMLLDYGAPEGVKTDNGSDYTSAHVDRVLDGLEADHLLCQPFQPWLKPHIERFFKTFSHGLLELLPGYIGHSVAERSAIEARKSFADRLLKRGEVIEVRMSGAELQAFCDQWLDIYHVEPHEGIGRTPFEAAAAQAGAVRRIADERALDVLLAEAPGRDGRRTVQKKGIRVDGKRGAQEGWYIAAELESLVGQDVQVRYDPVHDLGTVYVFAAEDLRFICVAQDPTRTGVDRRELAIKARQMQRKRVQDQRRALRSAAKRVDVDQVVQEILRERAAAAGKLAVLPVRQAVHSSAGLEAAAAAARAAAQPRRTTADIENLAEVQAARERIAAQAAPVAAPASVAQPVFETVAQRMQWLLEQAQRRELGTEERESLAAWRRTQPASYRRMAEAAEAARTQHAIHEESDPGRLERGTGSH